MNRPLVLVAVIMAMTSSMAQAQQGQSPRPAPTVPGASSTCARPAMPAFPASATAISADQLSGLRRQRDTFFLSSDTYLNCVNNEIESRMRAMFASGAAADPVMDALGKAHSDASRDRATVFERFVRLCMAWEDSRQAYGVGRCTEI
jgi:hypothetical protein